MIAHEFLKDFPRLLIADMVSSAVHRNMVRLLDPAHKGEFQYQFTELKQACQAYRYRWALWLLFGRGRGFLFGHNFRLDRL